MTHIIDFIRELPDYAIGCADADCDIASGKLGQRDFGPSPPWWENVTLYLGSQYEIVFDFIDVSTDSGLIARSIGYNERMRKHIAAKFGRDVVENAYSEAERNHTAVKPQ